MGSEDKDIGQTPVFPSDEWSASVLPGVANPLMTFEEIHWLQSEAGHETGENPELYAQLVERERIIDHFAESKGVHDMEPENTAALESLVSSIAEAKRQLPPSR